MVSIAVPRLGPYGSRLRPRREAGTGLVRTELAPRLRVPCLHRDDLPGSLPGRAGLRVFVTSTHEDAPLGRWGPSQWEHFQLLGRRSWDARLERRAEYGRSRARMLRPVVPRGRARAPAARSRARRAAAEACGRAVRGTAEGGASTGRCRRGRTSDHFPDFDVRDR